MTSDVAPTPSGRGSADTPLPLHRFGADTIPRLHPRVVGARLPRAAPTRAGIWPRRPRTPRPGAPLFPYMTNILNLLRRLPFQRWKQTRDALRPVVASTDWPEGPDTVTVDADRDTVEEAFRDVHWEDTSGFSIEYEGEVLNLRRPAGRREDGTPLEDHVRFRETDDGLEGNGHREPSRLEAKTQHVEEDGLEWLSSQQLAALVEEAGLQPDV